MIKKHDTVNVENYNKINGNFRKNDKEKLCVYLISPYNMQEIEARNNL